MILTDSAILLAINKGEIVIEPYDRKCLGSNSYDVHLSKHLATYCGGVLDAKKETPLNHFEIPKEGFTLMPGVLYLGSTQEYTETHNHVPYIEGKSSTGRLGINIHATAGKGDIGFCNYWTFEITVAQPVVVYEGMPIAQLIYFSVEGKVINPYHSKPNAKYIKREHLPVGSQMWRNF